VYFFPRPHASSAAPISESCDASGEVALKRDTPLSQLDLESVLARSSSPPSPRGFRWASDNSGIVGALPERGRLRVRAAPGSSRCAAREAPRLRMVLPARSSPTAATSPRIRTTRDSRHFQYADAARCGSSGIEERCDQLPFSRSCAQNAACAGGADKGGPRDVTSPCDRLSLITARHRLPRRAPAKSTDAWRCTTRIRRDRMSAFSPSISAQPAAGIAAC